MVISAQKLTQSIMLPQQKIPTAFREKSNSDGTAVVDINSKTSGLKSQEIHFVD